MLSFLEFIELTEKNMTYCNRNAPKGFSCIASCKARGKIVRTSKKFKGKKIKSKKYGGPA